MKAAEIVRLSIEIVQSYYQNDLRLFFEYVDDDILWYGPAKGQFLSGRQTILDTWGQEANPLTFSLGSIRADWTSTHPSYCEVMLSFPVATHFPDGTSIPVDQIIHITWCERKQEGGQARQPRMRVIHISNLYQQHESDRIYPVHFNRIYKGYVPIVTTGRRLYFRGVDHADYYLLSDMIQWIESSSGSRHAIIHLGDESIEVTASVRSIEKTYPSLFVRCHVCYLVNLRHVTGVKRFRVVMEDGTELPIPEKNYTAFRKKVREYRDGPD
ncbi:MAG: LytTR family transcriptional regulator [Oscillospiraceae bacterium]|nr:LytTR family transcriptional regulator [Oscillospiraceae bacterium]